MPGKKKAEPKVKQEAESEEPVSLRRSTRATRGSIKPVVDLEKELEVSADEDDAPQEVQVKREPARRSSAARREPAKKEPVKRTPNKKPVVKPDSEEANATVKEEEDEEKTGAKTKTNSLERLKEEPEEPEDDDVLYELNEKEMKEINQAFDMNRLSDSDEILNTDGVRTAIRSLGFEPRGDEIKRLMKRFSKGNKVNRDAFHKMMAFKFSTTPAMKSGNRGGNDEISRVFNLLDLDRTGFITMENLKSIAKELNENLTEDDLREMISEADQDHDFMINKFEFEDIMKKTNLY